MKFYKNLGEALKCIIETYLRKYPDAENVPVFELKDISPLYHSTSAVAKQICDYCSAENGWYVIASKYIENEPHIPLDYGRDYYVDKETGLVLIERENEYNYLCLSPAILQIMETRGCS